MRVVVCERSLARWLLVGVLASLTVRALVGGTLLILDPSGGVVGLSAAPLAATPLETFAVPGLTLLVVFGAAPIAVCYALYTRRPVAWVAAAGVGVALLAWVAVETALGFDRPTLAVNTATGVVAVALAVHPAVRDAPSR